MIFTIPTTKVRAYGVSDAYSPSKRMNEGQSPFVPHRTTHGIAVIIIDIVVVIISIIAIAVVMAAILSSSYYYGSFFLHEGKAH